MFCQIYILLNIPLDEYPIIVTFPTFAVPGYLLKKEKSSGIKLEGCISILFGTKPDDLMKKYGATGLTVKPVGDKPTDFARMIAKIAFSMAIATGAYEGADYSKSFVLPAILGIKDDIGHWVGTITEPIASSKYHNHRILIHRDKEKKLLIGDVKIFSSSETPRYGVILGTLN